MKSLSEHLLGWLEQGQRYIGEVVIRPLPEGGFELRHAADESVDSLECFTHPEEAREIAKEDGEKNYRPLKTAPNLRRGWCLRVRNIAELLQSLDALYPAAIGMAAAHQEGRLRPVTLGETIGRQTGMYRIVNKLTLEQRDTLVSEGCRSKGGCLRTILWELEPGKPVTLLPGEKFDPSHDQTGANRPIIPLFCAEACNLLVAAGRTMAKQPSPA